VLEVLTLNPKTLTEALNPKPYTLTPKSYTLHRNPYTLNTESLTPNPKP